MKLENVPGIQGIDTRALTKKIREKGTMLGRIVYSLPISTINVQISDPNSRNLVEEVSVKRAVTYNPKGSPRICAIDCGLKYNQIRCLINRGARVDLVPWDHKLNVNDYDGLFLSNGPGDPTMCHTTINNLKDVIKGPVIKPIFGICLGHQLLSVAVGCESFKMK
jgi:carbamoyl-phosphate synthase/aspartate carbamoyltransferase/dihydroorotase